jgi:hypothetical protein
MRQHRYAFDTGGVTNMNKAICAALAVALALPAAALAQEKHDSTMHDAGQVASQPVRDVGIEKTKIPPILIEASDDPYGLTGMSSCAAISHEVRALNRELGPDLTSSAPGKKTSLAKAGGAAVVNSLIPFRNVVREVSGAAAADRRLLAAEEAGFARRGFLRGVFQTRRCRGGL